MLMNKYYSFYSTNGTVALPADNCQVYFTHPVTLIPSNYIFGVYDDMVNYFIANPTLKVQHQVFKVLNYNNGVTFFEFDGYNIVVSDLNNNSDRKSLNYIDIFSQDTSLKVYLNDDRENFMTISANNDQGLEGLGISYIYINNVAGTTFSITGMN